MEAVPWTVTAFKRQRLATWKASRLWLIGLVLGIIGFEIPFWLNRSHVHTDLTMGSVRMSLATDDEPEWQFTLGMISFIVFATCATAIIFAVRRHYRCPKCMAIPMGSFGPAGPGSFGLRRDVLLNPSICPNCGARLR